MRLKELIGEIYEPRSPDEARFIQKHVTKLFQNIYAGTEYDPLFKGSKVKYVDRSAENHGYDPGADEKVYEEARVIPAVPLPPNASLLRRSNILSGASGRVQMLRTRLAIPAGNLPNAL